MSELRVVDGRGVPHIRRKRLWWDAVWVVEHPHLWRSGDTMHTSFWLFEEALGFALERRWERI